MILKENFEEFADRVSKEFIDLGFNCKLEDDGSKRFDKNGDIVIIHNVGYCVQIYLAFVHDWSTFAFPSKCVVKVVGNSLFYYGELFDDE